MQTSLDRRLFCLGAFAAAAGCAPALAMQPDEGFASIERRHGGRLGVMVVETGSKRTTGHRADERFLLESTFKGPLAAMVLARSDAGAEALDRPVRYGRDDLLPGAPVTTAHVPAGTLTVGQLVAAILEHSDNTAANLLLRRVGGPPALTAWLRGIGDGVTRIDRYELVGGWSGLQDTTTPRAIAATAASIGLGAVLRPPTRQLNNRWMAGNVVGRQRLRGAFPHGWPALDRTGTGDTVRNDYAIVFPPARPPLVIAAYYEKPSLAPDEGEAVLREVGAVAAGWDGPEHSVTRRTLGRKQPGL